MLYSLKGFFDGGLFFSGEDEMAGRGGREGPFKSGLEGYCTSVGAAP